MSEERIPTMPQGASVEEERIATIPQGAPVEEERIPTMPQGMSVEDERIPTMPQGVPVEDERIPTMPQGVSAGDERIPTIPQGVSAGDERIPTIPQGMSASGERIATVPQNAMGADGRVATMPQQSVSNSGIVGGKLLVTSDLNFTGDRGNSFVIEGSNVISADSGESQIYGCHKLIGTEKLVARILISITPESDLEKRQTRDKVIKFLEGVSANENTHILPLLDHGTININGKDYYVEIYPFCEGGDLGTRKGQISFTELHDEIIPALNQALHFFHSAGFVHRDVKPDNLYKYNGKVVIGDFGITCDLREDGFATDKYKTGTLGYYAPELMSQAAIKASDYYSFGQTIWTLYSGEMMYRNVLRRYREYGMEEQRNQVNFAMLSNTYYGLDEISKEDAFFEVLIRGLLQYDPTQRFHYALVNRWLAGDKSVVHELADYDSAKTFTRAFRLFGVECWDDDDVCKVLSSHWEEAIDALYDGMLKDFYASQNYEHARFLDGIMKNYAACSNEDAIPFLNSMGLAKTLLYFSKNKILCWNGAIYKTLSDIGVALGNCIENNEWDNDYYGLISSELIGEWYSSMSKQQEEVVDALNSITTMLRTDDDGASIAYYWLYYLLAEDRNKLQIDGCHNLQDYVRKVLSEKALIYGANENIPVIDDLAFLGLLCAWGYEETVFIFQAAFDKDYASRYEMFFDFIEQQMETDEDKKLVRMFYCENGPKAHLTWWKNNLNTYSFCGTGSRAIKDSIEAVRINSEAPIMEQRETFGTLEGLSKQFLKYVECDLFMGYIGAQGISDDYIYTEKLSGTWQYEFLGQTAPFGFKFYLGI